MNERPKLAPTGLRLPPDVRGQIAAAAAAERRSLNSQIIVLIERGLRSPETKAAEVVGATPTAESAPR